MSTLEKLKEDIKSAMRAREQKKLTVLRGISAAVKQYEVDKREEVTEEIVKDIFNKEIKKRKDALGFAEQAERQDLIDQNNAELEILYEYVGAPLSEEELKGIISAAVSGGASNIGAIMGVLNKDYKGRFDGKLASSLAKEAL